jgi:hypothetical protein
LAGLDEINHFILIAGVVHIGMARDPDGAAIGGLALQRIAQLPLEIVQLGSLLDHNSGSFK